MNEDVIIGRCGVCCDHCAMGNGRIPGMAGELKRFIDAYGYDEWIRDFVQDFNFDDLIAGLAWFCDSGCINCLKGGGMPGCEVRSCCLDRTHENCYFCEDFSECDKLGYQKDTYQIETEHEKIGEMGYVDWIKEQAKKTVENFDNIEYLEKRGEK